MSAASLSTHVASPHCKKITVTLKDVCIFYSSKVTNSTSRRAEVVVPDPSVIRGREVNLKMLEWTCRWLQWPEEPHLHHVTCTTSPAASATRLHLNLSTISDLNLARYNPVQDIMLAVITANESVGTFTGSSVATDQIFESNRDVSW